MATYICDCSAYIVPWMAMLDTEVIAYRCRAKCRGKVLRTSMMIAKLALG